MDHSATFARHFSRLVWLMLNESGSVDEQKMSLRAVVQASKLGPVALSVDDLGLRADADLVPSALTGVADFADLMTAHSVQAVSIGQGASAADLLGLARILVADAAPNDGGAQVTQKLQALGAKSVALKTSVAAAAGEAAEAPAALVEPEAAPAGEEPVPAVPPPEAAPAPPPLGEDAARLMQQMLAKDVTRLSPELVFEALDSSEPGDIEATTRVLDDLVTLAEHSARVGKPKAVGDILQGVLTRERKSAGDLKSVFVLTMRRLSKPMILRAVAGMIVKHPERKQQCFEVLERTGEDGAEAVVEQVGLARSSEERAEFLEVLTELKDAVPALTRMLGDSRWFVVRNAADLLGEMVAKSAEDALVALLRHNDDRVRRSATNALLKLGTPDAVKGVYDAVHDSSPAVRMQVAAAISTRKDAKTSATLIRAVDGEADGEVQLAMIAALGKVATADAVNKLVKLAQPASGLFKKKDAGVRVAAVQALGDARTPAAVSALEELADDKDRDVRETAARALSQAR